MPPHDEAHVFQKMRTRSRTGRRSGVAADGVRNRKQANLLLLRGNPKQVGHFALAVQMQGGPGAAEPAAA